MSSGRRLLSQLVLFALVFAGPLAAQSPPAVQAPPAAPAPATLEEVKRLVEEQRKLIAAQQEQLDAQEKRLAALEGQLEQASALALAAHNEVQEIQQQPPEASAVAAVEKRLAQVEQSVQRVPELAVQNLQGDFPGSFKVPGSDAALRIGGRVRMVVVDSFDAIGSADRFIASSIPMAGTESAAESARLGLSVIPTRLNFDLRTPTGVGYMRAYIEGDFAGSGNTFRLRHAFGQWQGWILGQTWSTFSDPEAEPDGIDFEGLNAISLFRQPQVRWSWPVRKRLSLAFAVEAPNPELTGATGVNQVPDFVARVRYDPERPAGLLELFSEGSHIQAGLLFRQLRGEVGGTGDTASAPISTAGYGFNISGVVPAPWARQRDKFRFAWNAGKGIGRYISDLNAAEGQDAVYDPSTGDLAALPVAAAYLGYEHWWRPTVRSTATVGYVWVDNLSFQATDALKKTERYTLNLAWSPIPRLDLVVEYLWGRRVNRDKQSGSAHQLQIGSTFRF